MRMRMHARTKEVQWGVALLRMTVGAIFLAHGLQKLLVTGMPGVAEFMGQVSIPMPMASAILVTAAETVCGLALVLGLFTRWAVVPLAIDMLVAMTVVHLPGGFFLPNGIEFTLALLAACVSIGLAGPGAFALDNVIGGGRESDRTRAKAA